MSRRKEFIIPPTGDMINLQENQDWILGGLVANVSYTEGFEA